MYSVIYRNLIFPVMEFIKGTKIQKYLQWLNKTQWWKPRELEELQNKKLRTLIKHAYENVPYYHRLFKKLGLCPEDIKTKEDLQKVPILTKEDIRKNLPDLLARNISKLRFIEAHSSGSTGEPLKYYVDKLAYSMGWAQTFRCWSWVGYRLGDPYVKISLNPRTKLSKKIQDKLMRCVYIYSSGISKDNLISYLNKMKNAKIIRSYASSIFMLANMIKEIGIDYKHIPTPKAITTTGETLYDHWRKRIEEVFNCEILDGYGGESTPVAFECPMHEGYHICAESVITEILRDNEQVSPGEMGEVVITNLENWVMPFIRYKLNDLATPSDDQCNCGRGLPMLESVQGRDTDIVITPNGSFLVVHFFTILFEYIEGVDQFQVIQERIDKLKIKIVKNEKFTENDLRYIISQI